MGRLAGIGVLLIVIGQILGSIECNPIDVGSMIGWSALTFLALAIIFGVVRFEEKK